MSQNTRPVYYLYGVSVRFVCFSSRELWSWLYNEEQLSDLICHGNVFYKLLHDADWIRTFQAWSRHLSSPVLHSDGCSSRIIVCCVWAAVVLKWMCCCLVDRCGRAVPLVWDLSCCVILWFEHFVLSSGSKGCFERPLVDSAFKMSLLGLISGENRRNPAEKFAARS